MRKEMRQIGRKDTAGRQGPGGDPDPDDPGDPDEPGDPAPQGGAAAVSGRDWSRANHLAGELQHSTLWARLLTGRAPRGQGAVQRMANVNQHTLTRQQHQTLVLNAQERVLAPTEPLIQTIRAMVGERFPVEEVLRRCWQDTSTFAHIVLLIIYLSRPGRDAPLRSRLFNYLSQYLWLHRSPALHRYLANHQQLDRLRRPNWSIDLTARSVHVVAEFEDLFQAANGGDLTHFGAMARWWGISEEDMSQMVTEWQGPDWSLEVLYPARPLPMGPIDTAQFQRTHQRHLHPRQRQWSVVDWGNQVEELVYTAQGAKISSQWVRLMITDERTAHAVLARYKTGSRDMWRGEPNVGGHSWLPGKLVELDPQEVGWPSKNPRRRTAKEILEAVLNTDTQYADDTQKLKVLEWLGVMTWEMTAVERRDDGSLVRVHTARIVLSDHDCIYLADKFKERLAGSRMVWASLGKVWDAMDSFHLMVPSYPPGLNLRVTTYPGTPENTGVTQVVRNVWYVHHHTRDAAIDHLRRARRKDVVPVSDARGNGQQPELTPELLGEKVDWEPDQHIDNEEYWRHFDSGRPYWAMDDGWEVVVRPPDYEESEAESLPHPRWNSGGRRKANPKSFYGRMDRPEAPRPPPGPPGLPDDDSSDEDDGGGDVPRSEGIFPPAPRPEGGSPGARGESSRSAKQPRQAPPGDDPKGKRPRQEGLKGGPRSFATRRRSRRSGLSETGRPPRPTARRQRAPDRDVEARQSWIIRRGSRLTSDEWIRAGVPQCVQIIQGAAAPDRAYRQRTGYAPPPVGKSRPKQTGSKGAKPRLEEATGGTADERPIKRSVQAQSSPVSMAAKPTLSQWWPLFSIMCFIIGYIAPHLPQLLIMSGDVEQNPGPIGAPVVSQWEEVLASLEEWAPTASIVYSQPPPFLKWFLPSCGDVETNPGPHLLDSITSCVPDSVKSCDHSSSVEKQIATDQQSESLSLGPYGCMIGHGVHVWQSGVEVRRERKGTIGIDQPISQFQSDQLHPDGLINYAVRDIRVVDRYFMPSVPITLVESCALTMAGLRAALEEGVHVKKYVYQDTWHLARDYIPQMLDVLHQHYPIQLPKSAISRALEELPMDLHKTTPRHWETVGQVDLFIAGGECPPFSQASGRARGYEDPRAHVTPALVENICYLYDVQRNMGGIGYIMENVPTAVFDPVNRAMLGSPVVMNGVPLGSVSNRRTAIWQNLLRRQSLYHRFQSRPDEPVITLRKFLKDFPGWSPQEAVADVTVKYNADGVHRILPKAMARQDTHTMRDYQGRPGAGKLIFNGQPERPTAEIKIRSVGGDPRHFSHIPEEIQHTIIGKSIDVNILRHVIRWGQEEARQDPFPGQGGEQQAWLVDPVADEANGGDKLAPTVVCALMYLAAWARSGGMLGEAVARTILSSVAAATETPSDTPASYEVEPSNPRAVDCAQEGDYVEVPSEKMEGVSYRMGTTLTTEDQQMAKGAMDSMGELWSMSKTDLGRVKNYEATVDIKGSPIRRKGYRLSHGEQEFLDDWCQQMLKAGVIEPSNAEWAAATLLPPKKDDDGQWTGRRVVHDYRPHNLQTDQLAYVVPTTQEILQETAGHQWYTVCDIRGAYNTLPIRMDHRDKTSFWGVSNLYRYTCMPMGLKNAGISWQRCIDSILQNVQRDALEELNKVRRSEQEEPLSELSYKSGVKAYADDIVIYSDGSFAEHLLMVLVVFGRLRKEGIKLVPGKMRLAVDRVAFLGHYISKDGIAPQMDKVQAIKDLAAPVGVPALRSFLGMAQYYAHFIPKFEDMKRPLTQLVRKNVKWKWGEAEQTAFEEIKTALTTAPVLATPDWDRTFYVHTDWSKNGSGYVLCQKDDEGRERVIAYGSSVNNDAEANYSSYEGELTAVRKALKAFRYWIDRRHFVVVTDHLPLYWLLTTPNLRGKFARMAVELSEYEFTIQHREGAKHQNADALSRLKTVPDMGATLLSHRMVEAPTWVLQQAASQVLVTCLATLTFMTNTSDIWSSEEDVERVKGAGQAQADLPEDLSEYVWDGEAMWRHMPSGYKLQVPPPQQRKQILHRLHQEHGHIGRGRLYALATQWYWWRGLYTDVKQVVGQCSACDRAKNTVTFRSPELNSLPVRPMFYRVSLDCASKLPNTKSGYVGVLIMIESMSKHVELVSLKNMTAATIAQAFKDRILQRVGAPAEVVTDNGPEFKGEFSLLMNKENIRHVYTPSDHPQANGAVERIVQALKKALRAYAASDSVKTKWDILIPNIQFGYNVTPQVSTGFSPYYIMYGRLPLFPAQYRAQFEEPINPEDWEQLHHFIAERAQLLAQVMPTAMENLIAAQERDANRYKELRSGGRKRGQARFQVGDFVYYKWQTRTTLELGVSRHILRVKRVLPHDVLELEGSDGRTKRVHSSNCQRCRVPQIYRSNQTVQWSCRCLSCPEGEHQAIVCDSCEQVYHVDCLPLVPDFPADARWWCPGCARRSAAQAAFQTNAIIMGSYVDPFTSRHTYQFRQPHEEHHVSLAKGGNGMSYYGSRPTAHVPINVVRLVNTLPTTAVVARVATTKTGVENPIKTQETRGKGRVRDGRSQGPRPS